ncbi:MAG TPA: GMC family oxidoreductase N-terminal domain-containing protein [Streptosporangiaceae bacterium]|jgi:choline dehydrogenase
MDYDYVIVGAGSAGCVLANRLSEDQGVRVALLEAGGPDSKMEIRMPVAFAKLFKSEVDWNFTTAKQAELENRELYWPRGKVLGGSSSLNAQMWVRGHQADYDGWGMSGWSYENVLPYFQRAERRDGSNAGDVYGSGGPLWISELRSPNPATTAFLDACAAVGLERLDELNGPSNEGFSPTPVTQRRGRRWSAADAYLRAAVKRPNLTVVTGELARRVIIEAGRATGVEYGDGLRANARREVILAAGAIGSPQLLMLSGIGDPEVLRALDIEPVAERPEVGRNLQDHLAAAAIVHCPKPVTLASAESLRNLGRFLLFKSGPLTSNVGEAVAFISTDPDQEAPDIELIFAPAPYIEHGLVEPPGHGVTIGAVLLHPESRGRITLAGTDPGTAPQIDPGYLTAGSDLRRLIAGLRFAERLLATDALRPYAGEPMDPWPGEVDDETLARYVRERSETLYHPVGTCRMGADDDSVVDPTLKVRGVEGLRVADVSIMPVINRGHTHAPAIMIGEKAADLIRAV